MVGTSGGNTKDMLDAMKLMNSGSINPVAMITHIGGLDSAADATINLPKIPGGKKLIYTNIKQELTALEDFEKNSADNPLFQTLAEIISRNNGLWSKEAEAYLLKNAKSITN